MLPTINTVLLSQCLDQAATVSLKVRKEIKFENLSFSLKELGYGEETIIAKENIAGKLVTSADYTFSQLNAVKADVLGSMSLPTEGKPTRNFQAGQVLSDMLLKLKRCPNDVDEFVQWCNNFNLSQGGLEGLKSLKFWPDIYEEFNIKNNNCSMINLIYLCFNAKSDEKKEIYEVLINSAELTNFCQESVKPNLSLDLKSKLKEIDMSGNKGLFFEKLILDNSKINLNKKPYKNKSSKNNPHFIKAIKIINKYFNN